MNNKLPGLDSTIVESELDMSYKSRCGKGVCLMLLRGVCMSVFPACCRRLGSHVLAQTLVPYLLL